MFISIVTSLALILQIGAFAVHFHPKHHEHEQLSLDIKQVQKAHHCDLCDAIIQIASTMTIEISIVNACTVLPYIDSPFLFSSNYFLERASSRAPPLV
ncbi:MAG: hypothetical protein RLZZ578_840 [Bacteroidota bacterium]|jgi:hypothetical protein